ncbi:hypothetical protein M9458_056649, partial [Cirrhinus mrigala]
MSAETPAASNPLTELVNALKAAFQPTPAPPCASGSPMAMPLSTSDQLFCLQQSTTSVNEYTLHFRPLAAASGWNETALLGAYRQGLNPDIHAAMALYDDSIGLESFLQRTTRVSQRLAACQPPVTAPQLASVAASSPVPEPIQIDSTRLSRTERNHCITNGSCLYCGRPGHLLRTCPIRPPRPVVSTLSTEVETTSLTLLPVTLHTSDVLWVLRQLYLPGLFKSALTLPLIRHSSPFITLQVGLFHSEEMRFLVLEDSTVSIILGRPWLQQHRPELSWGPCDIIRWINVPHSPPVPVYLSSTPVESPEPSFTPEIPAEYMAFQDVFSKQAATHLPPHQPWDCAIELLPGTQLPKGRVYPLSIPERQEMEEYIAEGLSQGFIQPSTSPAASSFFVGKKDGGFVPMHRLPRPQRALWSPSLHEAGPVECLQPCSYSCGRRMEDGICDTYWPLSTRSCRMAYPTAQTFMNEVFRESIHRFVVVYIDDILIYSRNLAEHRQHVQQVLHKLRDHSLYLKLEKCEFHRPSVQFLGYITVEGVQMDQGKVSAIQEWPQPLTIKELQHFLGFFNFYRCFIKDYSSITAPLTSLLRGKPKALIWNPSAYEAFQQLKKIFSTAPLLHHPAPELPFTVEVDASTTGVGAVLSQAVGEPPLLHPCAFYSWKLSPLFRHFGLPEEIMSDRGPQFISHIWKAFFKLLGVSVNLSSGYHPQTNGQAERKIKELEPYLRAYCHKDQHSWSRFLPWAEYAQNSLRQDTTGLTPF